MSMKPDELLGNFKSGVMVCHDNYVFERGGRVCVGQRREQAYQVW